MKKQQLLENKQHGTPAFPFECFRTQTDTTDFFIPLHWHKKTELMQVHHGTCLLTIGNETYPDYFGRCNISIKYLYFSAGFIFLCNFRPSTVAVAAAHRWTYAVSNLHHRCSGKGDLATLVAPDFTGSRGKSSGV